MFLSYFFGLISYNIIAILSIIIINYRWKVKPRQRNELIVLFTLICFLIFSLGNVITNDYYPYKEIIEIIKSTKNPNVHVEQFWINTIQYLRPSHEGYIVSLGLVSFTIFYFLIRNLKPQNLTLFLALWFIFEFVGTITSRAILFYMTFYLGLTLFGNHRRLIGIIIIVLSFFIHKTGYIASMLFILSILSISKKFQIIILSIIILLALILKTTIMSNINDIYESIALYGIPGSSYLLHDENLNVIGNIIWSILPEISDLIMSGFILYILYKSSLFLSYFPKILKQFYYFCFWGISFYIGLRIINLPDPTICGRTLAVISLPALYLFCELKRFYSYSYYNNKWLVILCFIFFICSDIRMLRVALINHVI